MNERPNTRLEDWPYVRPSQWTQEQIDHIRWIVYGGKRPQAQPEEVKQ